MEWLSELLPLYAASPAGQAWTGSSAGPAASFGAPVAVLLALAGACACNCLPHAVFVGILGVGFACGAWLLASRRAAGVLSQSPRLQVRAQLPSLPSTRPRLLSQPLQLPRLGGAFAAVRRRPQAPRTSGRSEVPVPQDLEDERDQLARAVALSLHLPGQPDPGEPESEAEAAPHEPAEQGDEASSDSAVSSSKASPAGRGDGAVALTATGEDGPWQPRRVDSTQDVRHLCAGSDKSRHYAVWGLAGVSKRAWAGVHSGHQPYPYDGLIHLNGGWGGLRWKRCATCEEAVATWHQEAHKYPGCPLRPPLYWWGPRFEPARRQTASPLRQSLKGAKGGPLS